MIAGMMLNGQSGSAIEFFARLVSEGLNRIQRSWHLRDENQIQQHGIQ